MKAVVSLSGGLDSSVLLHHIISTLEIPPSEIHAVSFEYGSKHNQHEFRAAVRVADWMGLPAQNHRRLDLTDIYRVVSSKSALLSPAPVPEGHYNDDTMKATVVPGRNLMFASILAAIAESGAGAEGDAGKVGVYLGIHQGDHHIYPDCRPNFAAGVAQVLYFSTEAKVYLSAPFLRFTKADIVREGLKLGTPFALTRTCYKDQPIACGKCGSCRERLEAFAVNNVTDPIEYEEGVR